MESKHLESALIEELDKLRELELSGFSVRPGLTGAGVTLLQGRNFFGSWRVTCGTLVWTFAGAGSTSYFAKSAEDAARHTMFVILRRLQLQDSPRERRMG
ncbi:MAG: hypothetical protein ACKVP4_12510 [Hyphomicrobium sp.]